MSEEKRSIQSLITGRIYVIHKELSAKEAELVSKKMEQLKETEKESERLNKELAKVERQEETRESLIKKADIRLAQFEVEDKTGKILAELNEMMSSTLRNCFNLTIAEIDKIDLAERQWLFLKLAEVGR